jgi:hypothetical protein
MKVIISNRSVYHKYAEVEIEVPSNIKDEDVLEYLQENEELFVDKIDQASSDAPYEYGSGIYEYDGMNEVGDSEFRFNIKGEDYGGHL